MKYFEHISILVKQRSWPFAND